MDLEQLRQRFAGHRPTLQGAQMASAVLVPLVERRDGLHLLYEVRAATLRHQPGEVCFPGGRMEPGESRVDCALRETVEELGIDRRQIEVLGELDFLLRGSAILYPVLAHLRVDELSALPINGAEVDTLFTVPLAWLRDHPPEIYRATLRPHPDDFPYEAVGVSPDYPWSPFQLEVPIYRGLPHPLWGLTARITAHLLEQLGDR